MLGFARDEPGGPRLTAAGRNFLRQAPALAFQPALEVHHMVVKRDVLGRRRAYQRPIFG
jgi:hypothetical protein